MTEPTASWHQAWALSTYLSKGSLKRIKRCRRQLSVDGGKCDPCKVLWHSRLLNFPSETQAVKTEQLAGELFISESLLVYDMSPWAVPVARWIHALPGSLDVWHSGSTLHDYFQDWTTIVQCKSLSAIPLTSTGGAWIIPKVLVTLSTYIPPRGARHKGTRQLITVPTWDPVSSNEKKHSSWSTTPSHHPALHTLPPSAHQTCNHGTVAVTSRCSHNGTQILQKRQLLYWWYT